MIPLLISIQRSSTRKTRKLPEYSNPLSENSRSFPGAYVLSLTLDGVNQQLLNKQEDFYRFPKWTDGDSRKQIYKDRISKQCAALAKRYVLTLRESEVMELLVRGNSVPRIAETLIISENTVQTYCKRLYTKLDIHKRDELLSLISELE